MSEQTGRPQQDAAPAARWYTAWLMVLMCIFAAPFFHVAVSQTMQTEAIVFSIALGATLIALSVRDLSSFNLPNTLTYPLIGLGLLSALWFSPHDLTWRVVAAATGYTSIVLVNLAYRRWSQRDGIGYGDAKLFAAAGAWLGLNGLPSVMLWACATGLAIALARHLAGQAVSRTGRMAFGPHLALGIWLVWLYGPVT